MGSYRIAALPGDGIGPEVMDAALVVLEAVAGATRDLDLDVTRYEAGSEHYRRTGEVLPEGVLAACLEADAVLLAAIGLPDVRTAEGTEVQPQMMMRLRRELDLYAAVRPIKLYPGVPSPLANVSKGIDFIVLRENLEGLFASFGGGSLLHDQVATDTLVITRQGTERVVRYAFELAARRQGRPLDGQRRVTCVDKANVFRSFALFRKVFFEVARDYPEIAAEAVYVDAMSLYMVQRPEAFDVLVMENQFGDILSDLGAGLVGSLGMAPSAEVGAAHGLFQPSHGSAPDIAGGNRANPLATILSAAMMLDWLGRRHEDPGACAAGHSVEAAVRQVVAAGRLLTPDLGGSAGTREVGQAVAAAIVGSTP